MKGETDANNGENIGGRSELRRVGREGKHTRGKDFDALLHEAALGEGKCWVGEKK